LAVRCGFLKLIAAFVLLFAVLIAGASGKEPAAEPLVGQIALSVLPPQGRETLQRILQGGPFPFEKDGSVFSNRERLLPGEKRGYYREYTVGRPGEGSRGARRIVCGGALSAPDTCYYSDDHYMSFRRIVR
jgi:ribonuclease T1